MRSTSSRSSIIATAFVAITLVVLAGCGSSSSDDAAPAKNNAKAQTPFCKAIINYNKKSELNVDGEFDVVAEQKTLGETLDANAPKEIAKELALLRTFTSDIAANQSKPSALKKIKAQANDPEFQESFSKVLNYVNTNCGITLTLS